MNHRLERYLDNNKVVEVIYVDRLGKTSKRTLRLIEIRNGQLKAYCFIKRAPRIFVIDNILAIQPVETQDAAGY